MMQNLTQEFPHAPKLEASILGAIITAPNSIYGCIQLLNDECFYIENHKKIWNVLFDMHQNDEVIDLIKVTEKLKERKQLDDIGGAFGLVELTSKYFSSDVEGVSKMLYEKYLRRKALVASMTLQQQSYNESNDVFSIISEHTDSLTDALTPSVSKASTIDELVALEVDRLQENLGYYQEVVGVPSGYEHFDMRTGGFGAWFWVLGGRPSMGKTTFIVNLAWNVYSIFDKSVLFFSGEMSKEELTRLVISRESQINSQDLKRNKITNFQLDMVYDTFKMNKKENAHFIIDDTPCPNMSYVEAQATKLKKTKGVELIVIDYLQLMTAREGMSDYETVSYCSRRCKQLSRNLGIPVIALAQLSRGIENRGGSKRPVLSDLEQSGKIEQDADGVSFIYRPEYYGIVEDEEGNDLRGLTEIITRKFRHGKIGIDMFKLTVKAQTFEAYDVDSGQLQHPINYNMDLVKMQKFEPIDFSSKIGDVPF